MAFKGIDVRATDDRLLFRALLLDSAGAQITSGTTNLRLYRLESDGTLASYDFNDNTFKTTALTTETLAMTHRQGNNSTTNTGIWTASLTTLTGFSAGDVIVMLVENTGASPVWQAREFQFGSEQGDLTVTASRLNTNAQAVSDATAAADRLEAALTTANGIDINMGQTTPGSPTADTTGEGLRLAHQTLPPGEDAPGTSLGLARTTDITSSVTKLVETTMQSGSTVSALVADSADLPTTPTDDIYNDLMLIAYDSSAGSKPNVRVVSDFTASSSTFNLTTDLDFTPEIGVDTFQVWALSESATLGEIVKLTNGFGSGAPNNLNSYLKAMMDKTATVPGGLGSYNVATDSLEALRDILDLMEGSGFSTATDSLKAIRDAIDALIAPAVVSTSALSGSGFLADCVSLVRKITDEPSNNPKYTDADLVELIQVAFDTAVADININTDHPILVRFNISINTTDLDYVLPPNVGEIWRIAKINDKSKLPDWEVWPGSEFDFSGRGFTIEGNMFRLLTPWNRIEPSVQILYVPNGEPQIHKATASGGTASTIVFPSSVTDGTLDIRPQAYAGYLVRILSGAGAGQERYVESYDATTRTATVRGNWTTNPDSTSVYEVVPHYSRLIKHVVCLYAALDVLSNEGNSERIQNVRTQLAVKMRSLRLMIEKKQNRFMKKFDSDTADNVERISPWYGSWGSI